MPSLKDLKLRIESVKSTRKITSAMKMVAAAKLKRAEEQARAARPYAAGMARLMASLAANASSGGAELPKLVTGSGTVNTVLLLVVSSDRGLCGMFNSQVVREARKQIMTLEGAGKQVKLFCVGRKARDVLRRDYGSKIIGSVDDWGKKKLSAADAEAILAQLLPQFEAGAFDLCLAVYNKFKSAISQQAVAEQLMPVPLEVNAGATTTAAYEFEPDAGAILADLLPRNLTTQVYRLLLESLAGEHGARMTAMDNATRNAGDMINKLTLVYNRTRQAYITKELIEIISGAEAV